MTHFVASTGTCGTITGTGAFLKSKNAACKVIGAVPIKGHDIPGPPRCHLPLRCWAAARVPVVCPRTYVARACCPTNTQRRSAAIARFDRLAIPPRHSSACYARLRHIRHDHGFCDPLGPPEAQLSHFGWAGVRSLEQLKMTDHFYPDLYDDLVEINNQEAFTVAPSPMRLVGLVGLVGCTGAGCDGLHSCDRHSTGLWRRVVVDRLLGLV